MADNLDIIGKVKIDTSDLNKLTSAFSGTFAKIGAAVAGVFAIDKITDFAKAGLQAASTYQKVQTAMVGLTGSSEKAAGLMKEIQSFALESPFNLEGLAEASQKMLAFGVASEDVVPWLRDISGVAASVGANSDAIDRFTRALGQMKGKGRVAGQEINQIAENLPGFNTWAALASYKGIDVATAMKQVADGAYSANDGIAAIRKGLHEFPGAAGALDRYLHTWPGATENFSETLGYLWVQILEGGGVLDLATNALLNFSQGLQDTFTRLDISKNMQKFTAAFVTGLKGTSTATKGWENVINNLGVTFKALGDSVKTFFAILRGGNVKAVGKDFSGLQSFILALLTVFRNLLKRTPEMAVAFDRIGIALTAIARVAGPALITAFEKLGNLFIDLVTYAGILAQTFTDTQGSIEQNGKLATVLAAAFGILVVGVVGAVSALKALSVGFAAFDAAKSTVNELLAPVDALKQSFKGLSRSTDDVVKESDKIENTVKPRMKSYGEEVRKVNDDFKKFIDQHKEDVKLKVSIQADESTKLTPQSLLGTGAKGAIQGIGLAIGTALATAIGAAVAAIGSTAILVALAVVAVAGATALIFVFRKQLNTFFTETLPRFLTETVPQKISDALQAAPDFLSDFLLHQVYLAGRGLRSIYDFGLNMLQNMWNGIQVGFDLYIAPFFIDLPLKILGFVAGAAVWLYNKGQDVIGGIWAGIQAAWVAVANWFINLPNLIRQIIANPQILIDKGRELIDKIKEGIDKGAQKIAEWAGNFVQWVTNAMGDILAKAGQIGTYIIDGLIGGIEKGLSKVTNAARKVFDTFMDGINKKAESHSPSRVMTRKAYDFINGFIIGLKDMEPELAKAAGAVADSAMFDLSPSISGINGAYGQSQQPGVTIGQISIHGGDADSVRSAIPELVSAIRAGVA